MSKIIITGATGNAGSATLAAALASPNVSHVTVLSRRAPSITHPKLQTILVPSPDHPGSFEKLPPSVLEAVKDHQGVIWALGVSSTQVKGAEYVKITHDYPIVAAEEFQKLGSPSRPFRFVYMSGGGARQDGKAMQEWANVKGQTEKELKKMETDSFKVLSVRPGGIMPTAEHYPHLPRWWRWGMHPIGRVLQVVYPPIIIESTQLGKACVDLVLGREDAWGQAGAEGVLENDVLRKM